MHCGIKKDPDNFDLALLVSDLPASSAGVFTQNRVCGAPVKVSRERTLRTTSRAVILNDKASSYAQEVQALAIYLPVPRACLESRTFHPA